MTERKIKCAACGSENLTAETQVSSFKSDKAFNLDFDVDGGSLVGAMFRGGDLSFHVIAGKRGRACLDCGHMMVFASRDEIDAARKLASKLRAKG